MRLASEVAGGEDEARLALSLVGYEPELQAAMEYVFGLAFVCPSLSLRAPAG